MNIESIIQTTLANFDFAYIISVNILTYIIISIADYCNKEKPVSLLMKRIYLVCSIIIISTIYYCNDSISVSVLTNSAIASPVFWSWVIKPIIKKTKLDYKQIDDYIG